jgi:hypothetical protein
VQPRGRYTPLPSDYPAGSVTSPSALSPPRPNMATQGAVVSGLWAPGAGSSFLLERPQLALGSKGPRGERKADAGWGRCGGPRLHGSV